MALTISVVIAASQILKFWQLDRFGTDFGMYWRVANGPLSMAYFPFEDLPFPYLPTMMLWIEPLAWIPLWPAYFTWLGLSTVALCLACRRVGLTRAMIALILISPPLISTWFTGQVTAILTAALLWACATSNRLAAGVALGIIASIKPQFVILAPLLLILQQDWRAFCASAVTFTLAVASSIIAFGLDTWFVWFASLDHLHANMLKYNLLQFAVTPASSAEFRGLPPLPFLLLGAALGIWLAVKCRKGSPLIVATAVGGGSLLASPYGLINDLAVVVPFLAWSAFRGSFTAAVALSGALNPLPLGLAAWRLLNSRPASDLAAAKKQ